MKLLFTIISILLIAGCRTIVDPAFNVSAQYINKLKSPVTLQLFSGGTMSKTTVLENGKEFNLYIGSDSPPMLYDYDSVAIILSNHHYKTDLNCSKLYHTDSTIAACIRDTISLFNQSRYKYLDLGDNNSLYIYEINEADSLETHP